MRIIRHTPSPRGPLNGVCRFKEIILSVTEEQAHYLVTFALTQTITLACSSPTAYQLASSVRVFVVGRVYRTWCFQYYLCKAISLHYFLDSTSFSIHFNRHHTSLGSCCCLRERFYKPAVAAGLARALPVIRVHPCPTPPHDSLFHATNHRSEAAR